MFTNQQVPRERTERVCVCVCFSLQSRAFEKTANQVKHKQRRDNSRLKVVGCVIAVAVAAIVIGIIVYYSVSSAGQ